MTTNKDTKKTTKKATTSKATKEVKKVEAKKVEASKDATTKERHEAIRNAIKETKTLAFENFENAIDERSEALILENTSFLDVVNESNKKVYTLIKIYTKSKKSKVENHLIINSKANKSYFLEAYKNYYNSKKNRFEVSDKLAIEILQKVVELQTK